MDVDAWRMAGPFLTISAAMIDYCFGNYALSELGSRV